MDSRPKWHLLRGLTARQLAGELVRSIGENDALDLAAQLAYYALLALFPFAILVLTLVGYIPLHGLDAQLLQLLHEVMPGDAGRLFDKVIEEVVGKQRGVLLLVSLAAGWWTASGVVSGAITALNRAQNVHEKRPYWKVKGLALLVTLAGAILLVTAMTALAIGPSFARHLFDWLGLDSVFEVGWRLARWPLAISSMMLMLAIVYWLLPDVRRPFRFISPGAVVAVLLWLGASLLFGLYASHFGSYAKMYGALAAPVVLMTWLWLSGVAVIIGGEINAVLDRAAEHALEKGHPDARREVDPSRERLHVSELPPSEPQPQ